MSRDKPPEEQLGPSCRWLSLGIAASLVLAGCGKAAPANAPRALSADSLQLLERALRAARPAFDWQTEALLAGIYTRAETLAQAENVARPAGEPESAEPEKSRSGQPAASRQAGGHPSAVQDRQSPEAAVQETGQRPSRTERRQGASAESRGPEAVRERPRAAGQAGNADSLHSTQSALGAEADSPWVVQIAAFGDAASAERSAELARQRYPERSVVVEREEGLYRVALTGWQTREDAAADLRQVQQSYPSAWLRRRSSP